MRMSTLETTAKESLRRESGKGRAVWLGMDQAELDAAYDQAVYAPNRDQVLKRNARNSELARARLGPPRRLAYGPTSIEGLDLYAAATPNPPVAVYIPGGRWRAMSRAARGASASPRNMPLRRKCSCVPAPISRYSTISASTRRAAT